ncbi:hypothetical protein JCM3774_002694 [Rhodotorula dairenensis]
MSGSRLGRKGLKRELATLQAEERRASTWLIRLSLVLLLLGWAYNEYASRKVHVRGRAPRSGPASRSSHRDFDLKPVLLGAGAALGGVRLLLRFHYLRRTKVIEESLLSDGAAETSDDGRGKRSSKKSRPA